MVDDEELEKLREERRQGADDEEQRVEQQKEQIKEKASRYLTSEARSRLGNIRAARPELASAIESQVARLGEMGQVDRIDDEQLKDILQNLQNSGDETSISFRK